MQATLGQRIRALRTDRGQRLLDVALSAGISLSYLNDLEHDRTHPSMKVLVDIAAALDLTAIELLRGVPPFDSPAS